VIRVLIADDEALVRAGFRAICESQADLTVVGEAANGKDAVEMSRRLCPQVIAMDIRMPEMDGIEATRLIVRAPDPPAVLVLTTFDLDQYVYEAMRAGAGGFLLKDAPREQFLSALRLIAAGDALLAPAITRRLIEEFVRRPPPGVNHPTELSDLSEREVEVLRAVAKGKSNAEIAEALFLSEATIKTHVSHILMKLGLRDRVQAVVMAYESGLVRPGTGP